MMPTGPAESEATDVELLARVQAGEVDAFAPLVRRHLPSLRAFVAMKLPVAHLADEIAHETFVFAFRHVVEFDLGYPFRAWLRGIAWNLVRAELLRYAREQANRSRFEQAQWAEWAAGMESESPRDEAIHLEECLQTLPPVQRGLIEQRYREGLTPEEMSARLGRSGEWVRVTLFRVRQQLRTCVESKLNEASHGA